VNLPIQRESRAELQQSKPKCKAKNVEEKNSENSQLTQLAITSSLTSNQIVELDVISKEIAQSNLQRNLSLDGGNADFEFGTSCMTDLTVIFGESQAPSSSYSLLDTNLEESAYIISNDSNLLPVSTLKLCLNYLIAQLNCTSQLKYFLFFRSLYQSKMKLTRKS